MMRVLHLTTVHPGDDARIFHKECISLHRAGYEVILVAQGPRIDGPNGVRHIVLPPVGGRLQRMLLRPWFALRTVLREKPDVCHFHDPELLLVALVLRLVFRVQVIYDVHEDVPQQIMSKYWIRPGLRPVAAGTFKALEDRAVTCFDAVVAATPTIAQRFSKLNAATVSVSNFPSAAEFVADAPWPTRARAVAYVGAITFERGILELLSAIEVVDASLILAGPFASAEVEAAARAHPAWGRVEYLGRVGRPQVRDLLMRARIGMVCLHPIGNYVESQPVKMFEYMAAGLPVIASDFPLWRGFVESTGSGVLVDPLDVDAISAAMHELLGNEARSRAMGAAGRRAVETQYSWEAQAKTLLAVYAGLERGTR